ncbi:MAG: 16S rRNA (adenine(1518)-N(6)/adenine(1519)-N(6))-dimethyltransferase RsmA [Synergistaceae bacterium]|jgi:16S rRNA (adenine1518-N6/adenine1519-N6)-dimethyltransferase|nr:16S rRNA (adenine(1518)-N(6)/adenine(1519)-N(6))-dimethyltransferase RsmA [Synergistaceae bacterium]
MEGYGRPADAPRNFFRYNTDIGQNFLRDRSVVEWMIKRAGIGASDSVLEVGPGRGILTRGILETDCAHLDAIELDTRLAADLEPIAGRDERLTLHWHDAVRFDYSTLSPAPSHVIANLPYHITTPLIWRLMEFLSGRGMRYMLLMTQHEAAIRITSGAPGRLSGPLGITIAATGEAALLRRVPRGAFIPAPRVDSSIVEVKLTGERPDLPRDDLWRRLLAGSFAQRRKTLVNNWAAAFGAPRELSAEILASHSIQPLGRPEELTLKSWLALRGDESLCGIISGARK